MLSKRLLSAAIGIPVLVIIFRVGGYPFLGLNLAIITLALLEYFQLVETKAPQPDKALGIVTSWLFTVGIYFQYSFLKLSGILVLCLLAILLKRMFFLNQTSALLSASTTFFGVFYIAVLFSYLIRLYQLEFAGDKIGPLLVWLPILATWTTDTAAYFTGLNLGQHQLAPQVSPNKTVEGAVGGIVGSILMTVGLSNLLMYDWLQGIWLGALIGVVAQLGDLCESAFKRDAAIKDAGDLIPGHGGMLDRIDSLLFTLPVVYYYLEFIILR